MTEESDVSWDSAMPAESVAQHDHVTEDSVLLDANGALTLAVAGLLVTHRVDDRDRVLRRSMQILRSVPRELALALLEDGVVLGAR
jgi:hypothetical protein